MGRAKGDGPPLTAAEKQRRYRAKRDADEQRRQEHLQKEKEKWERDKATKRKLCQKDLLYDGVIYPGIVKEVNETHCQVKCMHPMGKNKYFWPLRDDLHWYPFEDLLTIIPPPERVSSRHVAIAKDIWDTLVKPKHKI